MPRTVRELGRLDIVVNNSGVAKVAPLAELTPDDWQAHARRQPDRRRSTAAARRRRT